MRFSAAAGIDLQVLVLFAVLGCYQTRGLDSSRFESVDSDYIFTWHIALLKSEDGYCLRCPMRMNLDTIEDYDVQN